jgi:maltooligosyltrehalose synthase
MPLATTIRDLKSSLANRRTERLAHRRLSQELAAFQTPAERAELEEMLGRYSAEDTEQIREILHRQDYERQRTVAGVGGFRA